MGPITNPLDNWVCVEEKARFWYYLVPILFQEVGPTGEPETVFWGYADACKAQSGSYGVTWANIMLLPGVWAPDYMERIAAMNRQLDPVQEVLTGLPLPPAPAGGFLLWPLPKGLKLDYASLYKPGVLTNECRERDGACPGVPPEIAAKLAAVGFPETKDSHGYTRYLIDTPFDAADRSYSGPHPDASLVWTQSGVADPFYGRNFVDPLHHSNGGLLRVVLNPVDLAIADLAAESYLNSTGAGTLWPTIRNGSASKTITTQIGWRPKGETAWRPLAKAESFAPGESRVVPVPVTGLQEGQEVEVMVNYGRQSPVEVLSWDPTSDAYANNLAATTVRFAKPNLQLYDIGFSPSSPGVGDEVQVTVTARNDATYGYAGPLTLRKVTWSVAGRSFTIDPNLTLERGVEQRFELGRFRAAAPGPFTIAAEVNPDRDQPAGEASWTDNRTATDGSARGVTPVDVEVVSVTAPAGMAFVPGEIYTVRWVLRNNSAVELAVPRVVTLHTGNSGEFTLVAGTVTFGPNATLSDEAEVMLLDCDDTYTVTVSLEPPPEMLEGPAANNQGSANTAVSACAVAGTSPGRDTDITVIVPYDCQPNPDVTSDQPCLNYDLRIPGWGE